jgi:hydrogenase maturation protein HypF
MAENEIEAPVLGVAWDGTGYGLDGSIWGGEFFLIKESSWRRVAHFRTFPLPGGEAAVKQPRRSALGLLYEMQGEEAFQQLNLKTVAAFSREDLGSLKTMLKQGINSPRTSSAGRLFDAVASLCGLRQVIRHEGQAAMELEFALGESRPETFPYAFGFREPAGDGPAIIDWVPVIREVIADTRKGVASGSIAMKFHEALVSTIVEVARRTAAKKVALSGGCFQNAWLTSHAVRTLEAAGVAAYWHQRVPPNDGGISLGQVAAVRSGMM